MTSEPHRQSSLTGVKYERLVRAAMIESGWTDITLQPLVGEARVRPDFEATDPDGRRWFVEAKGGKSERVHTDSTNKAIAQAVLLKLESDQPVLVVYERIPTSGVARARLIQSIRKGYIDAVAEVQTPRIRVVCEVGES